MKVHRDEIIERLRESGRYEEADRALAELPERFDPRRFQGQLQSYGVDPESFRMPPIIAPPGGAG